MLPYFFLLQIHALFKDQYRIELEDLKHHKITENVQILVLSCCQIVVLISTCFLYLLEYVTQDSSLKVSAIH